MQDVTASSPMAMPRRAAMTWLASGVVGLFFGTTAALGVAAENPSVAGFCDLPTSSGMSAASVLVEREVHPVNHLRRVSGLTWDQIASIFSVSSRSVHFWASGALLSAANQEKLSRVIIAVRKIDRGSAAVNRNLILGVSPSDEMPLDLLREGKFERFVEILGHGHGKSKPVLPALSAESLATRETVPLKDRLNTGPENIPPEAGEIRVAKTLRIDGNG